MNTIKMVNTIERIRLYRERCGQIATFARVLDATFELRSLGARVPMKRLGIISVAVASLTGAAAAADLPVKTPSAQPAPPAYLPFTWTGAYAGASGGYGWTTSGGLDATGGFGGGQIGYNFQTGNLVFGIEGDIAGADISQTGIMVQGMPFTTAFTTDTLASLRGRAGLAYNSWLFYGTVGAGWTHDRISTTIQGVPFSSDQWLSGWTAGAGVEWAFAPNWSTKFEYQHYGLGTAPNSFGTVPTGKVDIDTLKIGINYLFR
jgi:outer membrane immunogenic protein